MNTSVCFLSDPEYSHWCVRDYKTMSVCVWLSQAHTNNISHEITICPPVWSKSMSIFSSWYVRYACQTAAVDTLLFHTECTTFDCPADDFDSRVKPGSVPISPPIPQITVSLSNVLPSLWALASTPPRPIYIRIYIYKYTYEVFHSQPLLVTLSLSGRWLWIQTATK